MLKEYKDAHFYKLELKINDRIIDGIFIDERVYIFSIPPGKYLYQIRRTETEDGISIPSTLEKYVSFSDFYGTFITDEELVFDDDDYFEITGYQFSRLRKE